MFWILAAIHLLGNPSPAGSTSIDNNLLQQVLDLMKQQNALLSMYLKPPPPLPPGRQNDNELIDMASNCHDLRKYCDVRVSGLEEWVSRSTVCT